MIFMLSGINYEHGREFVVELIFYLILVSEQSKLINEKKILMRTKHNHNKIEKLIEKRSYTKTPKNIEMTY